MRRRRVAGLEDHVDIRTGDALETVRDHLRVGCASSRTAESRGILPGVIDRGDEDDDEDDITEEDEADALGALADLIAGDEGDRGRAGEIAQRLIDGDDSYPPGLQVVRESEVQESS